MPEPVKNRRKTARKRAALCAPFEVLGVSCTAAMAVLQFPHEDPYGAIARSTGS